jgi:hypothetical protein
MKINIYINVATVGHFNHVLFDLLTRIKKSGLYESTNKVFLLINGDKNLIQFDLTDPKIEIIESNKDISHCEFPTLAKISNDSQNDDFQILYLHTKGVTRQPYKQIIDWTNYLSYFNINQWQNRISDLKDYDCSGVNLGGNPDDINLSPTTWGYGKAPLHYSGNFWWSKAEHIRKLPDPYKWIPDNNYVRWRMMAEMWLCQINGKYFNAWSSGVDHYQSLYPESNYIF